jgi:hypothetical protein
MDVQYVVSNNHFHLAVIYSLISNSISEKMTRKRKRPAYNSQGDEALDLHFETSIDTGMRESSLGLIPPIVTLPPAGVPDLIRDTSATKVQLLPSEFNTA